jgi:hypothetical protein
MRGVFGKFESCVDEILDSPDLRSNQRLHDIALSGGILLDGVAG